MVEFCTLCGTSLPKGDLSFKGGKIFTSTDYNCPSCLKTANPVKETTPTSPEPELDRDLVFKKGTIKAE